MKKINVQIYGGKSIFGGKEERCNVDIAYCDKCDSCSFYKNGTCFNAGRWKDNCKLGHKERIIGYTSRASKYYEFYNQYKKDELYDKLKEPESRIGIVDDTVILNINLMQIDDTLKVKEDVGLGRTSLQYIPLEQFTNQLIKDICDLRPRRWLDYTIIESYYEKEIPYFLDDLKRNFRDIYNRFVAEYPQYDKSINYVGREALLSTINKGITLEYKSRNYPSLNETWFWNGKTLKYVSGYVDKSNICHRKSIVNFEIEPTDDATIEITNNNQVNESTKFVN
jgi:hypothetical protein